MLSVVYSHASPQAPAKNSEETKKPVKFFTGAGGNGSTGPIGPTEKPLIRQLIDKGITKTPGIVASIPTEFLAASMLNQAYKLPAQSGWGSLFTNTKVLMQNNFWGNLRVSSAEIMVHRMGKVLASEAGARVFSVEKYGLIGSILAPSAMVFAVETATAAPFHQAMTMVQSGNIINKKGEVVAEIRTITDAFRYTVSKHGYTGIYRGAWAMGLKGLMFSPFQIATWRAREAYLDKKLHEQSYGEKAVTVALGALSGTFGAAIPTALFRDASTDGIKGTDVIRAIIKDPINYLKRAYDPKVTLPKAGLKSFGHFLQYAGAGPLITAIISYTAVSNIFGGGSNDRA